MNVALMDATSNHHHSEEGNDVKENVLIQGRYLADFQGTIKTFWEHLEDHQTQKLYVPRERPCWCEETSPCNIPRAFLDSHDVL